MQGNQLTRFAVLFRQEMMQAGSISWQEELKRKVDKKSI